MQYPSPRAIVISEGASHQEQNIPSTRSGTEPPLFLYHSRVEPPGVSPFHSSGERCYLNESVARLFPLMIRSANDVRKRVEVFRRKLK
ncbi:hypothetical protein JTE90_005970 [Oedothorax gibbosus]|uniref:Uncharacterized protein n=1 Tax=Oedothorax gibbosus TaxID=931172 RepID=A0AAV6UYL7_9ARAC|nr:hypothetical protein JTE90_005970 [Oedothorax gibbosus]